MDLPHSAESRKPCQRRRWGGGITPTAVASLYGHPRASGGIVAICSEFDRKTLLRIATTRFSEGRRYLGIHPDYGLNPPALDHVILAYAVPSRVMNAVTFLPSRPSSLYFRAQARDIRS